VSRRTGAVAAALAGVAIVVAMAVVIATRGGGDVRGSSTTGPTDGSVSPAATGPPAEAGALPGIRTGPTPWPAESAHLAQRMAAMGMPPLGRESVDVHIHQNLVVDVHGGRVRVPLIGQVRPGTPRARFAEIHTHGVVGTIHVEAAAIRHYTLGDVFDVWGVRFGWGPTPADRCLGSYCDDGVDRVRVFLDGRPYPGDPTELELADEQVIVVTYGSPDDLPDPMPSRFRYERPPR
jgi:hypothetical protein